VHFFKVLFVVLSISILSSCSILKFNSIEITDEAKNIINNINQDNSQKKPCKGTGTLKILTNSNIQTYNIAFASDAEKKIRIEFLTPLGLPAASLAYNGSKLYFKENSNMELKTYSSPDMVIKKILGFKVDTDFISHLFCGKTPLIDFNEAYLYKDYNNEELILRKNKLQQNLIISDFKSQQLIIFKKGDKNLYSVIKNENGNFIIKADKPFSKIIFEKKILSEFKNPPDDNIFVLTR
jgi:hypothetical protein